MIRIAMSRFTQTVELELPTDYEHVLVSLWKLGLKRDPGKYTLRDLNAVFRYDTPEEHQMIRLIDSNNSLLYALHSLHEMIAPPFPIASKLLSNIRDGYYNTADEYYQDLEKMVYSSSMCQTYFLFPISGQLVDKNGIAKKAPWETMVTYERMIEEAVMELEYQALFWETELFSDVEGAYQKIMSAGWSIRKFDGRLYGHVLLIHTEPFTEEEELDLIDKIEMINSTEFAIRLKQWSVLTDDGLLFIYLCDEDGDYSLYNSDVDDDDDEDDEPCMCPDCQELMRKKAASEAAVLPNDELENVDG